MLCRHVFGKISSEFYGISHVFVNFAGFCGFTWNSRLRNCAKYQKPCINVYMWPFSSLLTFLICLRDECWSNKKVNFLFHKVSHQIYSQWNRLEESWGLQMYQTQVKQYSLFSVGRWLAHGRHHWWESKLSYGRL